MTFGSGVLGTGVLGTSSAGSHSATGVGGITLAGQSAVSTNYRAVGVGALSVSGQSLVEFSALGVGTIALAGQSTVDLPVQAVGSGVIRLAGSSVSNKDAGELSAGVAELSFIQSVSGYIGAAGLRFSQLVGASGFAALVFEQTIGYATGSAELWFDQAVGGTGSAQLGFSQNIYSVAAVNYANWDVTVTVGGVDIGSQLTGEISIEADRNAARLSEFTVLLSGTVNPLDWVGKPVTIDYTQDNGTVWRRFTGVILEPSLNLTDMTMLCTCSDDLQRIVDNHDNAKLLALAGGCWSKHVFTADVVGWDYLQDVLSTVATSVEIDAFGALKANSWQNKITADYTFDADIIDDGSLSVGLGQRNSLINRVDITFDARFERLYHREARLFWLHDISFCEFFAGPIVYPDKTMLRTAVDAAGWTLVAENYTDLWPTQPYSCAGTPIQFFNRFPDGIRGFDIRAAKRWQQSVTDQYQLTVKAPAAITAYNGELATSLRGGADFKTEVTDWGEKGTDFAIPVWFALDDQYNYYRDDIKAGETLEALQTLVAVAVETINKSHRANSVRFTMPLAPYLELNHTIAVDDVNLQAKGVIRRLRENYVFDTGEATTEVELAISAGHSGQDVVEQTYSVPAHPTPAAGTFNAPVVTLPLYVGGKDDSPALDETWTGILTNKESPTVNSKIYPVELRLPFDAVPDDMTQNKIEPVAREIAIAVPHNTLTITA